MSRRVLSLFSGIGGIDLGLERAGWEIAAQVEIDPFCLAVLAKHWPDVARWTDIKDLDPHDITRTAGPVDLIAAGFPCQPVSLAGQGLAQEDPRWLWPHVVRLVRDLRPRYIFLENVPGLLGRGLGDVLGDLAALGYDAEWDCIAASDVGAPHQRDRLWIVAYPQSIGRTQRRAEHAREHGRPDAALGGDTGVGQLADADGAGLEVVSEQPARQERPTAQRDGSLMADADGQRQLQQGRAEQQERGRALHSGQPRADTADRQRPTGNHAQSVMGRALDGLPGRLDGHRWPAPYDPENGSPQYEWEPARTVGRGVPNRPARVKALGNAVVPQVVEIVGRWIAAAEEGKTCSPRLT